MPIVRAPDGSLRVQSGGISLPWTLGEDRAMALGAPPMGLPPGATAFGDSSSPGMSGGAGNVPASVSDVPMEVPGAGGSSSIGGPGSGAGGAMGSQDQGGGVGAPAAPEMTHAPPEAPKAKPEAKKAGLHDGAKETDDLPDAEPTGQRLGAARNGGGARLIPGKMQLAGYTQQKGANKANLDAMNASNAAATEAAGQSVAAQAMGETARNASQVDMLGQQIAHKQELVGSAEKRIANARAEYDATQAEIDNERGKVDSLDKDPHRYFAGNGAVPKILGLIAAAVGGGIQSGLNHSGRNPYLDGIMSAIKEDNTEHQRRKDVRRGAVNLRQKQLDARMAHFDPDAAARELEADKLSIAAAMDNKFALATKNPEIIAASQARQAELIAQRDAIRAENNTKLGDQITERHVMTPDRIVGGTPAMRPEARERMVTFGNGSGRGFVVAGPAREKVQSGISNYENLTNSFGELAGLAEQAHTGNLEAQRKYNALRGQVLAEANVAVGQGAISKDDLSRVEMGAPDVTDWTTTRENAVTRLKQSRHWAKSRRDTIIRDNVYQDPDATAPVMTGQSQDRRPE